MNIINFNPNYRIKGCNQKFINDIARKQFYNGLNIDDSIDNKICEFVSYYTIQDCIKIILNNGNFYDAFIRCKNNPNKLIRNPENNIYDDTLLFHRNMAFDYLKELVKNKINNRIIEIIKYEELIKNENFDKTCSICLNNVNHNDDNWIITKCNHLFHKRCISKWNKNTCPLCRKRYYL